MSGHKIQQWRRLLSSATNKTRLIAHLVEEWKESKHREKLQDKTLYLTCGEDCFKLDKEHCEEATELKSSQEEADTCMLLHALHAAELGYSAVIIQMFWFWVWPSAEISHGHCSRRAAPRTE